MKYELLIETDEREIITAVKDFLETISGEWTVRVNENRGD